MDKHEAEHLAIPNHPAEGTTYGPRRTTAYAERPGMCKPSWSAAL